MICRPDFVMGVYYGVAVSFLVWVLVLIRCERKAKSFRGQMPWTQVPRENLL